MRVCVFWDVKTVQCRNGPSPLWNCTIASSWRVLVDAEKVTWAWKQCIPSILHEPLAQEHGVTYQKTNFELLCGNTISSKRFTSQHPSLTLISLSLSRQSLFLEPNQVVSALHHSTSPSFLCSLHCFLHWAKQRPAPKQATKVWDVPRSQTWRPALAKGPWGPHLFQLTNNRTAGVQYKKASLLGY
jgi:hypothetical protein